MPFGSEIYGPRILCLVIWQPTKKTIPTPKKPPKWPFPPLPPPHPDFCTLDFCTLGPKFLVEWPNWLHITTNFGRTSLISLILLQFQEVSSNANNNTNNFGRTPKVLEVRMSGVRGGQPKISVCPALNRIEIAFPALKFSFFSPPGISGVLVCPALIINWWAVPPPTKNTIVCLSFAAHQENSVLRLMNKNNNLQLFGSPPAVI